MKFKNVKFDKKIIAYNAKIQVTFVSHSLIKNKPLFYDDLNIFE